MILSVILLIIGFVLLIKGADFFVEGSSAVAKRLRVPSVIIGLTIVAMGTSLPECAVSITAAMTGNNELAISNAVGSNIFNLMIVCGFCALFTPLIVDKGILKKEFPFSILCAILLAVFGYAGMTLGRGDGLILLAIFLCFVVWMLRTALKARSASFAEESDTVQLPVWRCAVYVVGGIIAIKYGGDLVVNGASAIAVKFGLSQNLIGLTIVACGTSLPELVTSIVAAKKNELDMALGNVIGSNIFNILFVLGIAASISPVTFAMENIIDIIVLVAISALVWVFAWTKQKIDRAEGIVMVAIYVAYLAYICIR